MDTFFFMSLNCHLLVTLSFSLACSEGCQWWRTNISITCTRGEYTCKEGKITIYHKGNSVREAKLGEGAEVSTGNGRGVRQGSGPALTTQALPPTGWSPKDCAHRVHNPPSPSATLPLALTRLPTCCLQLKPWAKAWGGWPLQTRFSSLPASGMLATVESQQPVYPKKSDENWKEMLCSTTIKMLTRIQTARTP